MEGAMKPITGRNGTPIIGVAGWKKSGKTTLTVRLVTELTRRGYRVATVKHAHHDLVLDASDADSARHRRAGAGQVAVVSAERWALITELRGAPEPDFVDVIGMLDPCDLIIVEGYKSAPIPKIEARRTVSFTREPMAPKDPMVIAIAADHPTESHGLPLFDLDDIDGLVGLIERRLGLSREAAGRETQRAPAAVVPDQS
jgi:molybdopterin-guanine dinucleotide biosynthesis protein B